MTHKYAFLATENMLGLSVEEMALPERPRNPEPPAKPARKRGRGKQAGSESEVDRQAGSGSEARVGARSWICVPTFSSSWHFRNAEMRIFTGTRERGM